MKPNIIEKHKECPNESHCKKDNEKCCYLVKQKCIIREAKNYGKQNDK